MRMKWCLMHVSSTFGLLISLFVLLTTPNAFLIRSIKSLALSPNVFPHYLEHPGDTKDKRIKREKINKYSNLTVVKEDPLESAMKREQHIQQEKTELRGTTVPTISGSNKYISTSSGKTKDLVMHVDIKNINPSDPSTFGYIEIGKVLGAHGINGEVKILLDTDFAEERVLPGSIIYIKKPIRRSPRPIKISTSRRQVNDVYIVQFDGIKSRITASALKEYGVFVKDSNRPMLSHDEHLIRDIVGLQCVHYNDREGTPIGVVVSAIPPHDIYDKSIADLMHPMLEIRKFRSKELVLVPYVSSIILDIDLMSKKMVMNPPDGLLDVTYSNIEKIVIKGNLPKKVSWLRDDIRKILEKSTNLKYSKGGEIVVHD